MPDQGGAPCSQAEARAVLNSGAGMELLKAAASYVVPLFWYLDEARPTLLHNGSGFFLRIAGPTLLVTAAHVIREYERDRSAYGSSVKLQLLDIVLDPLKHLIDIDDAVDIATIRIQDDFPPRLGKWVYQRNAEDWPPEPPTEGRGLFFLGFPAAFLEKPSVAALDWGSYGGLLTATAVRGDTIVSQLDRDHVEPLPGLQPPPLNAWLGGMSGAPGWTLTHVGWRLAGVLYQYSTDYELFYFRRADAIGPDGHLNAPTP